MITFQKLNSPCCNVDIANIEFEEFTAGGREKDGWWEVDSKSSFDLADEIVSLGCCTPECVDIIHGDIQLLIYLDTWHSEPLSFSL